MASRQDGGFLRDATTGALIVSDPGALVVGPVASRAEPPAFTTQSNGTDTGANQRVRHRSPQQLSRMKLRFGNIGDVGNTEGDGPNQITIRAAVEYPAGTYHPVFFAGKRDITLDAGAQIDSDYVDLLTPIPVNTDFWTRTYVTVASGSKWMAGIQMNSAYSEAGESGTSTTDKTTSGTITGTALGVTPCSIIAPDQAASTPRVFLMGDSITVGYKDTVNSIGWVARAMEGVLCYQRAAIFGETAQNAAANATSRRRFALSRGCNVGVPAYGTNDINAVRTAAQVLADLQTIGNGMVAAGMKVYVPTLPPRTTSTDGWATTGNQTPLATEAVRTALNDLLRAVPAPFSGVLDFADIVETARNSGIWKAGYTSDGIHGKDNGYAAIAAGINWTGVLKP